VTEDYQTATLWRLLALFVWSYDFVAERTHDGRSIRMLTVIDEYGRECPAIVVERSLQSDDVPSCLTELFVRHGIPE